jgi:hypothetical protein
VQSAKKRQKINTKNLPSPKVTKATEGISRLFRLGGGGGGSAVRPSNKKGGGKKKTARKKGDEQSQAEELEGLAEMAQELQRLSKQRAEMAQEAEALKQRTIEEVANKSKDEYVPLRRSSKASSRLVSFSEQQACVTQPADHGSSSPDDAPHDQQPEQCGKQLSDQGCGASTSDQQKLVDSVKLVDPVSEGLAALLEEDQQEREEAADEETQELPAVPGGTWHEINGLALHIRFDEFEKVFDILRNLDWVPDSFMLVRSDATGEVVAKDRVWFAESMVV